MKKHIDETPGVHQKGTGPKGEALYLMDDFIELMAHQAIKLSKQLPKHMSDLLQETKEAKAALEEAVTGLAKAFESIRPVKESISSELRSTRMTATMEAKALMESLRTVREFFIGKDHDDEVRRLKEFVDLCERLQKLQASGFLDKISDTILKLS